MTDHEKFKALLEKLGLSYRDLAELLRMKYDSVKNQLAPAKNLPKWAVSMLITFERLQGNPKKD
jgi:transcriptional regulator with XRE-family HTH domain